MSCHKSNRPHVLSLAHDIKTAGHLGHTKTTFKLLQSFYWPGVYSDVSKYVKSCHNCQISEKAGQHPVKAPLIPIPVMSEPFQKIQIDCVGPLNPTSKGNMYHKEYHDKAEATLSYANFSKAFYHVEIENKCSMAISDDIKCKDNPADGNYEFDVDVSTEMNNSEWIRNIDKKVQHLSVSQRNNYMLKHDIIEPSSSSWSSPCILVAKPDGSNRFVTDFRRVNSVTKPDSFPIPRLLDCIDKIGNAKYISVFDCLKGYWQLPLTGRTREVAAFCTPRGLWQYKVAPFGMRNSGTTFQRLINRVTGKLEKTEAYVDDVAHVDGQLAGTSRAHT